jgi:hypothetical protein
MAVYDDDWQLFDFFAQIWPTSEAVVTALLLRAVCVEANQPGYLSKLIFT